MKTNDEIVKEFESNVDLSERATTYWGNWLRTILTQKDAEVAEERKRIENDVLAPLYEKIDGWYKERYDIVGQGALASVFEEALKALTPNPTEGTSDKSN